MPDRKLIEAQVEFGMFPADRDSGPITDHQEQIIADTVARRVQVSAHKKRASQPRGPRPPKRVMQALAAKLRAEPAQSKTIWQRACDAIADDEVEGAEFDLNSEQKDILRGTYDKAGCVEAKLSVTMQIDGTPYEIKVSSLYDYFMERVKS